MRNQNELSRKELKNIYGGCEEHIRRYRNEQCLSQDYMATKLGITLSGLSVFVWRKH